MDGLLEKLPFRHNDVVSILLFVLAVAAAVMVAKKLPVIGRDRKSVV